jgi:hypothetical protein
MTIHNEWAKFLASKIPLEILNDATFTLFFLSYLSWDIRQAIMADSGKNEETKNNSGPLILTSKFLINNNYKDYYTEFIKSLLPFIQGKAPL